MTTIEDTLIREKRKATKEHECCVCHKAIQVGDEFVAVKGPAGVGLSLHKHHMICDSTACGRYEFRQ